jgi:hypothetical protein
MYNIQYRLSNYQDQGLTTGNCRGYLISGEEIKKVRKLGFHNSTSFNLIRLFFYLTEILFEDEILLILVGLHLHPGTCVPNIYHMSMRTVLSVLSYVAFTQLV